MENEKELLPEERYNRAPKVLRILGRILKYTFLAFVAAMILWLSVRAYYQNGTPYIRRYVFTEEAAQLLKEERLTVKTFNAFNDNSLERAFYIGHIYYTEELGQFQFMLRYNRFSEAVSAHIKENGLNSFLFVLKDDVGNVYSSYAYVADSRLMYGYYRLVFDNVETYTPTSLVVEVYLASEGEPIEKLEECVVWYSDAYSEGYTLSGKEKSAEKPTPMTDVTVEIGTLS